MFYPLFICFRDALMQENTFDRLVDKNNYLVLNIYI
jgi:hypothetical protein